MNRNLWLLVVFSLCLIAKLSTAHPVNETSVETESEESHDEESDGVAGFFKKLGSDIVIGSKIVRDGVVNASRTVKEGVKSGFEFVKNKLTPSTEPKPEEPEIKAEVTEVSEKPVEKEDKKEIQAAPEVKKEEEKQIPPVPVLKKPEEEEEPAPVWDFDLRSDVTNKTEPESNASTNATELDNRNLLDAPTFCPSGQKKDRHGRCRATIN